MKIDILVLNYNGKNLLEKFLPSITIAASASRHDCAVTVVDNKSSDNSYGFVRDNFPSVSFYSAKENKILCSYNEVAAALNSDVVILLNNDIKLKEDFVDHLADNLKDENTFFAAPKILNFDNTFNGGKSRLIFKWGVIKSVTEKNGIDVRGRTDFISCGAFRREIFLKLGGFDELYLPGIWEDVDLCYRARRCGYKGVYEPKSIMWHDESATFNKVYGFNKKMELAHRNMFLFFWKNITDIKMFAVHLAVIIPLLLAKTITMQTGFVTGFFKALFKIGPVLRSRKDSFPAGGCLLTDRQLIG